MSAVTHDLLKTKTVTAVLNGNPKKTGNQFNFWRYPCQDLCAFCSLWENTFCAWNTFRMVANEDHFEAKCVDEMSFACWSCYKMSFSSSMWFGKRFRIICLHRQCCVLGFSLLLSVNMSAVIVVFLRGIFPCVCIYVHVTTTCSIGFHHPPSID